MIHGLRQSDAVAVIAWAVAVARVPCDTSPTIEPKKIGSALPCAPSRYTSTRTQLAVPSGHAGNVRLTAGDSPQTRFACETANAASFAKLPALVSAPSYAKAIAPDIAAASAEFW